MKYLLDLVKAHKSGRAIGIYSACSAHPLVIEAVMLQGKKDNCHILIESTSNQVDQNGGYTGMTPPDFVELVFNIADQIDFDRNKVIFGGDHLGPNTWQHLDAKQAMQNSEVLIEEYVKAGFKKIHLDCSMACSDDPIPLGDEIKAKRAARLCQVGEETAIRTFGVSDIVYVIGTEVPVPGGETEEISTLEVTSVESAQATVNYHLEEFAACGLMNVWQRVIGLVVQPGVEFDHHNVFYYQSENAQKLKEYIEKESNLLYEAHSTDYQKPLTYKELVKDHFAILKVGPALTFKLREALFLLSDIERALIPDEKCSDFLNIVVSSMNNNTTYWEKYYSDNQPQQSIDMQFSLSDRIRYYWSDESISHAVSVMIDNLSKVNIPLTLLSQYLPKQFDAVVSSEIKNNPKEIILNKIMEVTEVYNQACLERN